MRVGSHIWRGRLGGCGEPGLMTAGRAIFRYALVRLEDKMEKTSRNNWVRIVVAVAFVVVALGAWVIGRTGTEAASQVAASVSASSGYDSYDIGAAQRDPAPTDKVKEFNLVAKEATVEIAPGVTVR